MKRILAVLVIGAFAINLSGCAMKRLSLAEEADWGTLLNKRVVAQPLPFKSVKGTGIWDFIVPGSGSTYAGGGEAFGWLIGGVLMWPISPFYQPAIGVAIARNENKRRTIEYYRFGSHSERIAKLQEKGKLPPGFVSRESAQVSFS